jgi:hypothetical protein
MSQTIELRKSEMRWGSIVDTIFASFEHFRNPIVDLIVTDKLNNLNSSS